MSRNMPQSNPIAAIATPHAPGGIGIVRISGDGALEIASRCFRPVSGRVVSEMAGYTAAYGAILDEQGADLDDGILTVFRAPHSYTGEDVAEISCHGGLYVCARVLEVVLAKGAVAAGPGEFTRRAFLNGKMSLTAAEAVMDLIGAAGERELKVARAGQKGALFLRIQEIKTDLVHVLGDLAAWADYPEDDVPAVTPEQLLEDITHIAKSLTDTLDTYHYGKLLRDGISTVIVGKPNVGKSTLFNRLLGQNRSIVTEIAGTTRDIVEERARLGDLTLCLSDTAGLRQTGDVIEKIGVDRAREKLSEADVVLAVFDGSAPLDDADLHILERLPQIPSVAIVNKLDAGVKLDAQELAGYFDKIVSLSAKHGTGFDALQTVLEELLLTREIAPEAGIITNLRQKNCLVSTLSSLQEARDALKCGEMLDAVTVLLDEALDSLLQLTGERVSQAVVDDVFSRFCVGK